jgi:ribulose-5-phosphate 4-epimerase/fuculose-1-phosphate aldolase
VIFVEEDCRQRAREVIFSMRALIENGLNTLSSGNASYFCRSQGFVILTPSGVEKQSLRPRDLQRPFVLLSL